MLCITRKRHESIFALLPDGGKIEIKIRDCGNNRVFVGIEAPEVVKVLRDELIYGEAVHARRQRKVSYDD